jgi:SAM-dependent methyltransferase
MKAARFARQTQSCHARLDACCAEGASPMAIPNEASGPGAFTEDGCAVEVYRRLSGTGEIAIVESVVPAGSTVLELGAGAGRVTRSLVQSGYRVTAVDSSAEMLANIAVAETVLAPIETLHLDRTFDAVLLGSNLINTPNVEQRSAFLKSCRRHVAEDGVVLIEAYVPARIRAAENGYLGERDGIRCYLSDVVRSGDEFSAKITYEANDATWTHAFSGTILDEDQIIKELAQAGMSFGGWLNSLESWFKCVPTRR